MGKKFGKWIGGTLGWTFGGPIGALVGFSLGYLWDNATLEARRLDTGDIPRGGSGTRQGDFNMSLLVLAAAMMKADDRVLKSELKYVKAFMRRQYGEENSSEMLRVLKGLLDQNIEVGPICDQIRAFMSHPQRLQLVHFLLGIANSDGELHPKEWELLQIIARRLNISHADMESLSAMFQVDQDRYYRILEIEKSATQQEIKTAYRKMAKKYHPDKLGDLGPEATKAAVEKFRQVQEAYDKLSK